MKNPTTNAMSATAADSMQLPAMRLVMTPRLPRVLAKITFYLLAFSLCGLFWVPWQQSVPGSGRVVALDPLDRPQTIEATIDGQVVEWYVREGTHVNEGDPLLKIADNDPELLSRLRASLDASKDKLKAAQDKVSTYHDQIRFYESARELQISIAQSQLEIMRQKLRGDSEALAAAEANRTFAEQVYNRALLLFEKKLVSPQDVESETNKLAKARTDEAKAKADVSASQREMKVKEDYISYARTDAAAKISEAQSKLREAEGDVATSRDTVLKAERDLARFETQIVNAPRDGKVVRLLASQGGKGRQVKSGEALLEFVPDCKSLAVEIYVDGNDAPWVGPDRDVRLQFEGWPAVQFTAGWPSAALGTYGGKVLLVDATDSGNGKFRVLVVPTTEEASHGEPPWPGMRPLEDDVRRELRQGVRVNGWIQLNEVTLGYELWRQLNGFPLSTTPSKDSGKGDKGGKIIDKKSK
jgi:multidrug resistance efflux pump